MSGIVYYIMDTETTGLKHDFHEIVEISIIRCTDRMQISRTIKAKRPENANYDALKITGKTVRDLYNGIDISNAINDIDLFFNQDGLSPAHRCMICHNVPFDKKFVHYAWETHGKRFPADLWLCTLSVSRKIAKSMGLVKPKLGLHDACDLFKIKKIAIAHNAKDDSRNTYLLWKHLTDNQNVDILEHIKRAPHIGEDDETPDDE